MGGKKTIDLSNQKRYEVIIGREYKTQIDLVIHNINRDFEEYLLTPPGGFLFPTIEEIGKMPKLPYDYNQFHRIHGVVLKGIVFEIIKVIRHRHFKLGRAYDSYPLLLGEIKSKGKFRGYKVLLQDLTNLRYHEPEETQFDTLTILKRFAIRIDKGGQ